MQRSSIPWTTKQISKMYDNGSLTFDNAVQRNFVWDKDRMSLLIDSMLRGYPIPPFYAVKTDRTVKTPKGNVKIFDCLDGKQRCTTVNKFKNNEFELTNLEPIVLDDGSKCDLNGLTYDTLPDELKDEFDTYSLTVYGLSDITDEEIREVMRRLNNGKPLSAIDITRIKAKDLDGIKSLGKHPLFERCLSEKSKLARNQEDIIVKTYVQLTSDNPSLDNKDIRLTYESLEITDEIRTRLSAIFDMILSAYDIIAENSKKTARKIVTKTHLISITNIVDKAIKDGYTKEQIAEFLASFFKDSQSLMVGSPSTSMQYNIACTNGSNHVVNVKIRLKELEDAYDNYSFNTVN